MDAGKDSETRSGGDPHYWLGLLVGEWEGVTRTSLEPDVLPAESPDRGVISLILKGHFRLHNYEGSLLGTPHKGVASYGYNLSLACYEMAWLDSFQMAPGSCFC